MPTRSFRVPLSIRIVIGVLVANLLLKGPIVWYSTHATVAVPMLKPFSPQWIAALAFDIVAVLYQIAALSRLSRWAPVVQAVVVVGMVVTKIMTDPGMLDRYPLYAKAAVVAPTLVYMALVLPHWRKMNWAPLGQSYRARSEPDVEVF